MKIFIESWKSPLLNFPMAFRVKRAKKFAGNIVWVAGHNFQKSPSNSLSKQIDLNLQEILVFEKKASRMASFSLKMAPGFAVLNGRN